MIKFNWNPNQRRVIAILEDVYENVLCKMAVILLNILTKQSYLYSRKQLWKRRLQNGSHFVTASMCNGMYMVGKYHKRSLTQIDTCWNEIFPNVSK